VVATTVQRRRPRDRRAVARARRRAQRDEVRFLMSASLTSTVTAAAARVGARGCIRKPFGATELLSLVARGLRRAAIAAR
jgi:DNA-binding response OmpR family regulator